jgi:hypothetical protein
MKSFKKHIVLLPYKQVIYDNDYILRLIFDLIVENYNILN